MGRIQIGKTMSQFSLKMEADENRWDIKAGRMLGKTKNSLAINQEINRINLLIHSRYTELLEVQVNVTAQEVKNAMQGIASTQDTVLVHFRQMNESIAGRVGIDLRASSLRDYNLAYKWLSL